MQINVTQLANQVMDMRLTGDRPVGVTRDGQVVTYGRFS